MTKVKKCSSKRGMNFFGNLFCKILMIICIATIISAIIMWIYGIGMHLWHGEFSEAFCWLVVGPSIMAMFVFFIAAN